MGFVRGNDPSCLDQYRSSQLANENYLIAHQSSEGKPPIVKEYQTHFGVGCSKALSCQSVCPAGIETLISIMKMNRR